MASFLVKSFGVSALGALAESKYGPKGDVKSALCGITPLILIGTGFWSITHGMAVGKARQHYMELAKKDGEADVEERYGLPNLYAQGTSKHALAFNCVQRSHQQIFESFPQLMLSAMVGAIHYPICAAVSALVYSVGRISFSRGYAAAEGDASKRYSNPLARFMWYGLLINFGIGAASCIKIITSKKLSS